MYQNKRVVLPRLRCVCTSLIASGSLQQPTEAPPMNSHEQKKQHNANVIMCKIKTKDVSLIAPELELYLKPD